MVNVEHKTNKTTGEELFYKKLESGLKVYIIPKKDYSQSYAIFGTNYGSVDSEFVVPGDSDVTVVPDGIAHYLEHKMFDQPDGSNVFDKFSKFGANANAFTSFNITAYLFGATSNIEENIKTLMDYVQSPYFTEESVNKEQGIIGQEIKMYDDSGSWKLFFNFINCLYQNHPIKKEIAGTVESISHINADYLYKCYNTFYNLSNMAIVLVGNIDVEKAFCTIEKSVKKNEPFTEEIKRIYPKEPMEISKSYHEQALSVASPLFMMGWKDTHTGFGGDKLLKKTIEIQILLKMLFGKSSKIYKKLYEQGLINASFSTDYTEHCDYAFSSLDGESKEPRKVFETVLNEIDAIKKQGLLEEDFERVKKVVWGRHIRMLNDVEDYASSFIRSVFMDVDFFNYDKVYREITFEDITNRFTNHFTRERAALSVINPVKS